jgi:hypothetical protein
MTSLRVSIRFAATVLVAALPGLVLAGPTPAAAAPPAPVVVTADSDPVVVNLRVEGVNRTIYEGSIVTYGRNVTIPAGGTHLCDGINNGANATPGGTATTALDDAAQLAGFDYDGAWVAASSDFFITRIGPDNQTATQLWGLLDNYQFTPTGGCQTKLADGDEVLWAFDAFNKAHFLKLAGPRLVRTDEPYTVTVTDGSTGAPVRDAIVSASSTGGARTDQSTDAAGHATFTAAHLGVTRLKADRADSVRSNRLDVIARPELRG